jgi:large subunit ribosomal protein L11
MRIKSMSATSGPPIGPVLGQYAIPISKFCAEFNERTTIYNDGVEVFVTPYHYADGSYSFELYSPVSSTCFKRAATIDRCIGRKKRLGSGIITPYMFYEAVMYKCLHDGGLGERTSSNVTSQNMGTIYSMGMVIYDPRIRDNNKTNARDN